MLIFNFSDYFILLLNLFFMYLYCIVRHAAAQHSKVSLAEIKTKAKVI